MSGDQPPVVDRFEDRSAVIFLFVAPLIRIGDLVIFDVTDSMQAINEI